MGTTLEELKNKVHAADMRRKEFKAWLKELKKFTWKGDKENANNI